MLALPRLTGIGFVSRFRVVSWMHDNATSPREALWAWGAVATSWVLRSLATFVLLAALGLGTDFALALAFVCASAASAVLPVAPAGAAVQAGAGAAILVAAGVRSEDAIAFGIAAQALIIAAGATCVLALAPGTRRRASYRFASAGSRRLAGAQHAHRGHASAPRQPEPDRCSVVVVAELL